MPESQFNWWYLNLKLHHQLAAPQVFAAAPEMLGAGRCAVASLK